MINLDNINLTFMPDGLPHVKVPDNIQQDSVVEAVIRDGNDLLKLAYLRPMLYDYPVLKLKYLAAQRMDRQIDNEQPFSLKIFCNFINNLNFDKVIIYCPHSDVMPALLNNVSVDDGSDFFRKVIAEQTNYYHGLSIVYPDAGAEKRFNNMDLGLDPKLHNIVTCGKHRDMQTGKLSGFYVGNGKPKGHCLILDDITDGAGTFSGLANVLRNDYDTKSISLATYHAILSKGWPISGIDSFHCTNSYPFKYTVLPYDAIKVYNYNDF